MNRVDLECLYMYITYVGLLSCVRAHARCARRGRRGV
jgi:hypothetical protein